MWRGKKIVTDCKEGDSTQSIAVQKTQRNQRITLTLPAFGMGTGILNLSQKVNVRVVGDVNSAATQNKQLDPAIFITSPQVPVSSIHARYSERLGTRKLQTKRIDHNKKKVSHFGVRRRVCVLCVVV